MSNSQGRGLQLGCQSRSVHSTADIRSRSRWTTLSAKGEPAQSALCDVVAVTDRTHRQ
jgi:hypothetical protein